MWKPIKGFEGKYEVSDDGSVRNAVSHRVLRHKSAGAGYKQVCLGARNYRYVHRLVASAFINNQDSLPQVNHLDGDKANNCAANLEWCSRSMNLRHAYETGLLDSSACKKPLHGARHPRSRAVTMLSDTGHISITYVSISEAAKETGIDFSTIHGTVHGKFKQAGGWCWKFA